MKNNGYSVERGTLCLIALLKAHNIKRIVASPGTTNIVFVGSVQNDPWFEVYSSVDERSAAYIACGMAAESGEPVAVVCTGATASRNYMPGLTEAFYRKLPVLAITYNAGIHSRYQLIAQQIDRSVIPNDVSRMAVNVPIIKDNDDEWHANVNINKALLALRHNGGGPVHIDISTKYSRDFSVFELPHQRVIERITQDAQFPQIDGYNRIAIFIGSHKKFSEEETLLIDQFCSAFNSVVFCDHTSGYHGNYRFLSAFVGAQGCHEAFDNIDLLIHLGEVSGDYYVPLNPKEVWRVNLDGEIKDTFRTLRYVFQMPEGTFFEYYGKEREPKGSTYLSQCQREYKNLLTQIPELPFSNLWIAKETASRIPQDSTIHLGILNSLRSWNMFELPTGVESVSNVGGFGIDGILSSMLGASLVHSDRLTFCVLGDLAFFYDLNALGNRHISNNMRIMLINNGKGAEFTNFNNTGHVVFGDEAETYIAAAGHFGNQSQQLIRHFTEDLGIEYMSASNKDEFLKHINHFTDKNELSKSIIFEIFTDSKDESDALETISSLKPDDSKISLKSKIKQGIAELVGEKGRKIIKIIRE